MPTTLFVQQQLPPPFEHEDDCDVHYLHHSNALYIISEHEYVRSLIPSAAQRELRVKAPPDHRTPRRIGPPLRKLNVSKPPRPLMATLTYASEVHMGLPGAPGSPPGLSNSKSSKSSSFHSTSLSDIMGPSDMSHFEDINLDDLQGAFAPAAFPMPNSPSNRVVFEAPRSSIASKGGAPHSHGAVHSFRDLTGGSKPRYPSLKGQINTAVRQQSQLNAPPRSSRRVLTSPSAPSLTNITNFHSSGRRSRSPSPSNPQTFPSAPRTLSRRSSRNLEVSPAPSFGSRRQSWQHSARKSVKELEAECDDEDDEVPEDAFIWNVPISPRPAQERSPAASACNSPPQRTSPPTSRPTSLKLSSSKSSPAVSTKQFSQPPSPNSINSEDLPPQPLTRQRTNTWEDTYTSLDPDAKKLTEALENFQAEIEKEQEVKRQLPGLSRSTSVDQPKAVKTKSLPPLRKSDPLIDPFQPSVEKQKYLSRTRPSWLPPKDPKEEKKHLKEYQKMLARIQESERLEAERQEREKIAREKAERVKAEYWEALLLPNWAREMSSSESKSRHRKMWWNGVPPKLRGVVWQKAIGNDLEISETTFRIALEKANAQIKSSPDEGLSTRLPSMIESTKLVFPDLKMFAPKSETSEEQPYHQDLVNICLAYASYRSDVDILAGIHYIAGLFLLQMSPVHTFSTLCNLLNRPLPLSFLVRDHNAITAAYDTTLSALHKKYPNLAARLQDLRVEPNDYLKPMFEMLFCGRLGVEHAARVMDVYAVEGDKIPPRVAVGVLGLLEGKLLGDGREMIVETITKAQISRNPDEFMGVVYEAGKSSS
ncbi:hypothetical protein CC78DRAFT_548553 [Lojkania enalia]|uniref:Rab-GAP TBC domain-containing protein n=1 Tax=Lojkania enalia TaxID=147567 RepID=A0A9P4N1Y5_9PLEO|nr:hypothetical protein CC78DRAFT_548553 [Didymosphaeria enalia]